MSEIQRLLRIDFSTDTLYKLRISYPPITTLVEVSENFFLLLLCKIEPPILEKVAEFMFVDIATSVSIKI